MTEKPQNGIERLLHGLLGVVVVVERKESRLERLSDIVSTIREEEPVILSSLRKERIGNHASLCVEQIGYRIYI